MKRQRFLEPFLEASSCSRILVLKEADELLESVQPVRVEFHAPGVAKAHGDDTVVRLRKMIKDVALLVNLAALHAHASRGYP